jgi:hypothetical protein
VVQLILQYRAARSHILTPLLQLWPARQVLALLLAYPAGFAASYGLDRLVAEPGGLILGLAGGTAAYTGALLLLGGLLARDRERAGKVLGRLRRLRGSVRAGTA